MTRRIRTQCISVQIVILMALLLVPVLAGCNTAPPQDRSIDGKAMSGMAEVPPPLGTALYPTVAPAPPPQSTPIVQYPAPPTATSLASISGFTPNLAWGVETSNNLTIWVGNYVDTPTPHLQGMAPLVRWNMPLKLIDLMPSPDHQTLAVLTLPATHPDAEGDFASWLSVINLNDNTVQALPAYSNYPVYRYYFPRSPNKILGWLDNNRVSVQIDTTPSSVAIASKDGASYTRLPFPQLQASAPSSALSPDRTTFFSTVIGGANGGGMWLYNTDGTNARQIVDASSARSFDNPLWSPDGSRVSFLSPKREITGTMQYDNLKYMGVWVLDVASHTQHAISNDNTWDVAQTWSADGTQIAFLRADAPITRGSVPYTEPDAIATNVYTANVSDFTPHRVTNFTGKKHRGLQWTPGGNLIASQMARDDPNPGRRAFGLVTLSTSNNITLPLLNGSLNESLVHPVLFR